MIVWLASYPRSGNTLARQVLRQTMGIETYSRYNDRQDIGADPELSRAVGHVKYEGDWPTFREHAAKSEQLFVVKTHHPPEDDGKAIYIVRDGRASLVSFLHFRRDLRRQDNVDMSTILSGTGAYGSWAGHLDAWQPLTRPNTLLVRFENLTRDPLAEAARIAAFLGVEQRDTWVNDLERLHGLAPDFFRFGSNARNIAELSTADEQIFWSLNTGWMKRLGYRK